MSITKKLLVVGFLVGMIVTNTWGATVDATDTADITFAILPYVEITFDEATFALEGAYGDTSVSDSMGYTANGNINGTVTIAVTTDPVGAPGTWDASVASGALTAGVQLNDTATVEVTGLTGTEDFGSWTGGEATITLTSIDF